VKKISKGHHSSLNELNITPLLDLAFVLLVIFIITTPQLSNDLEMNLPSPKKNEEKPRTPPKINRIRVEENGTITLNDQKAELPALREMLASLKAADPDNLSVVVLGASAVDYQRVISVLDILQQLDITRIGLATVTVN
jgi:biopolymer transport protein ExbD